MIRNWVFRPFEITKKTFNNNWASCRALIGWQLWSMIVRPAPPPSPLPLPSQTTEMKWWWRDLSFSYLRVRFSKKLQQKWTPKTIHLSMVFTLIDYRNDVKMFNENFAISGSTWVLKIVKSFRWSIKVQTLDFFPKRWILDRTLLFDLFIRF